MAPEKTHKGRKNGRSMQIINRDCNRHFVRTQIVSEFALRRYFRGSGGIDGQHHLDFQGAAELVQCLLHRRRVNGQTSVFSACAIAAHGQGLFHSIRQ